MESFSERHGFVPEAAEIITREAPSELRSCVVDLAYEAGMRPTQLRALVCRTLFLAPNLNNWSEFPNIDSEVRQVMQEVGWYDVYDVIEAIAADLPEFQLQQAPGLVPTQKLTGHGLFERRINLLFKKRGIGWQLVKRKVEYRGSEPLEQAIRDASQMVQEAGRPTAAREIHEAIRDLGRRPDPEITGAIQHAMAALECVARDHVGSKQTLGEILKTHRDLFPPPLDVMVDKAWGFSSNFGRHLQEGKTPTFDEAELMVGVAAILSRYLARKSIFF